ncbi:MAG: phosphoribosylglycinamide formyltransferase [Candidatus Sericytochromatia bacterium]|nr:phosphoribosylglycinamide formyltransferase [Candidatus Sericytochromatia bacterium]
MTRLAVFASGKGSNLARILAACQQGTIAGSVVLVVCNEPGAGAVGIARMAGIPVLIADHRDYPSRVAHERAIVHALDEHQVILVVLAGYMRLLSPFLLGYLYDPRMKQSRVISIHPTDPALYQGPAGYAWAIATGQTATAVTVQYVDEGMDTGRIILQEAFAVLLEDTVETLKARGQAIEHRLFPRAIQHVVDRMGSRLSCAAS